MIWKIYKLIAGLLVQSGIRACMGSSPSEQDDLLTQVNRLYRITTCIRAYYGLHPSFAATTYGSLNQYLKQRLSQQEWLLLNQLQVVKSGDAAYIRDTVLDVA
jgi:hypothetical protein